MDKIRQSDAKPNLINELVAQQKMDANKRKIKAFAAVAIPTLLVLYSAYKLPKLPDHKSYETLKVVGVIVGGVVIGLSSMNFGGGTQTNIAKASIYSAIFLVASSLPYLASRALFSAKVSTSLKIAAVIGVAATGFAIYRSEIKPKLSTNYGKSGKQILGETSEPQMAQPIQSVSK